MLKRVISIVFCLAFILLCMSLSIFADNGNDNWIDEINVNGFIPPFAGNRPCDINDLSVPEGAPYVIDRVAWMHNYSNDKWTEMYENEVFIEGDIYYCYIELHMINGYSFAGYDYQLNGSSEYVNFSTCSINSSGVIGIGSENIIATSPVLTELNINGFVPPAAGQTPSDLISALSVPEGAYYYIGLVVWNHCSETNQPGRTMRTDEVFAEGESYFCQIYVYTLYGCSFQSGIDFKLNNSSYWVNTDFQDTYNFGNYAYIISADLIATVPTTITELNVNGFVPPAAGDKPCDIDDLSVPDGAPYVIDNVGWCQYIERNREYRDLEENEVFIKGKQYYCWIQLHTINGYSFSGDDYKLNGSYDYVDSNSCSYGEGSIWLFTDDITATGPVIREVNVTASLIPVAGESQCTLSVPEGSHYYIDSERWNNREGTFNEDIVIPNSDTDIGIYAFCGCTELKYIQIPSDVTTISDGTFAGCSSLSGVTVPAGVADIGEDAFDGCESLQYIVIPVSVLTVGNKAFNNCDNLEEVYYSGSAAQWNSITIGEYNTDLLNAWIRFNASAPDFTVEIGEAKYRTLSEALENASDGSTVTLISNISNEQYIIVTSGITLDLNGYNITNAKFIWATGEIIDSEAEKGIVSAAAYFFDTNETWLPIFNGSRNGYSFYDVEVEPLYRASDKTHGFRIKKTSDEFNQAISLITSHEDLSTARIQAVVTAKWTDGQGKQNSQDIVFSNDLFNTYINGASGSKILTIKFSGFENLGVTGNISVSFKFVTKGPEAQDISMISGTKTLDYKGDIVE